ncbi:hypothetical protein BP6252_06664 [Coleophoma cylindrospora]|uniref:Rhodopsin domain-containing protein n=1 Tax=Coleophoma cylindrospora TaxID=1849047 RepID=A0A3D8RN47_9HELO|nr:hypothetical protein BP6252_06664 [Coleophoma cylindrospora]
MTLQFLATIITICLQCRPITFFWNKGQLGTCIDTTSFTYFQNAYTIFSDIVIIILPLPFLLEVNRATSQKFALATIFMIGILSTIASCVRLSTIRAFALAKDPIYDVAPIILWSHIEIHLGVICACAPALKGLFSRLSHTSVKQGSLDEGILQSNGVDIHEVSCDISKNSKVHGAHLVVKKRFSTDEP